MNKQHRNALKSNRVALVQDLEPRDLINHLIESGVLNDRDSEEIRGLSSRQTQAEKLLDTVPRKGPTAFDKFIHALSQTNSNKHLALLLTGQTTPSVNKPVLSKPVQHDYNSFPSSSTSSKPDVSMVTSPVQETRPPACISVDDKYNMSRHPHGWCLIINNVHFNCGLMNRLGSDKDAAELRSLFHDILYYNVRTIKDLTAQDIAHHLESFAQEDHSPHDSVVVCLLSHGVEGGIYGTDGDVVNISDIVKMFTGQKSQTLAGKPKMFFIQACRGGKFDGGTDDTDSAYSVTRSTAEILEDVYEVQGEDVVDAVLDKSLPSEADFLLAYATVPGYVSWRNPNQGSWFIQSLVNVFRKHAGSDDVLSMLVRVNAMVAEQFESHNKKKQMPSPVVMLTRKIVF